MIKFTLLVALTLSFAFSSVHAMEKENTAPKINRQPTKRMRTKPITKSSQLSTNLFTSQNSSHQPIHETMPNQPEPKVFGNYLTVITNLQMQKEFPLEVSLVARAPLFTKCKISHEPQTKLVYFRENNPHCITLKRSLTDNEIKNYENLTQLDLEGDIEDITNEGIKALTNLTALNLSDNDIITDKGVRKLIKLKRLNLSFNHNITDNVLTKFTNLCALNLGNNDKITDKAIAKLTGLRCLDLEGNKKKSQTRP